MVSPGFIPELSEYTRIQGMKGGGVSGNSNERKKKLFVKKCNLLTKILTVAVSSTTTDMLNSLYLVAASQQDLSPTSALLFLQFRAGNKKPHTRNIFQLKKKNKTKNPAVLLNS